MPSYFALFEEANLLSPMMRFHLIITGAGLSG
jgi:hypothetical protein